MATEGITSSFPETQKIDLVLPSQKTPFFLKFIGALFWLLLTYLLCQFLIVASENQIILKWWGKGTGVEKRFNNRFNIWLALCAKQSSTLLFYLIWIFVPLTAHQSPAQMKFVTDVLFKFRRVDNEDNTQSGIMIPRHLAQSILLQYNDGDLAFKAWYDQNKTKRILTPDNANDPATAMLSTSQNTKQINNPAVNITIYTWQPVKDTGRIGIYPMPLDREGWKCCIQYWLNGDGPVIWAWMQTERAQGEGSLYVPGPVDYNNPGTLSEWFDIKKHPDNILARYGIAPSSPIVVYFANGFYNDDRMTVPSTAFTDLVDGEDGDGGWVGFLSGQPPDFGEDQYKELIYTEVNTAMIPPQPPCSTAARVGLSVLGSLAAGLSTLAFAPAEGAEFFIPFVIGLAVTGAAASGAQSYQAAKKDSCS
jgi:hypothetical protein